VSVIVPVHQAAHTIEACLSSLLRQTLAPELFEVLLVFNGADDGGYAKARMLAESHPAHRVLFLHSDAKSAGAARNLGLDGAIGEHVTFVDADDWVSNNYLAELLAAADGVQVPAAGVVDVTSDGAVNSKTAVMRQLAAASDSFVDASALSAMTVGKLWPGAWVSRHRFDPALRSGEDVAFNGTLLASFSRRFARYALAPFDNGALYYRRLTPSSISRAEPDFDFAVTQRLAVITALVRGDQRDPKARTPLTNRLVSRQAAHITRYLETHPDERAEVLTAVALAEVAGLTIRNRTNRPEYEEIYRRRAAQSRKRLVVAAGTTAELNRLDRQLEFLAGCGMKVRLVFTEGTLTKRNAALSNRRVSAFSARPPVPAADGRPRGLRVRTLWVLARRITRKIALHALPTSTLLRIARFGDPTARDYARRGELIAADDKPRQWATLTGKEPLPSSTVHRLVLECAIRRTALTAAQASAISRSAKRLGKLPRGDESVPPVAVWALTAWRLHRNGHLSDSRAVAGAARAHFPDNMDSDGLRIVDALARPDKVQVDQTIKDLMAACDAATVALGEGDADRAVFLLTIASELVFAHELSTASLSPLLLQAPERVLSALRHSSAWRLLEAPTAGIKPDPERRLERSATLWLGLAAGEPPMRDPEGYPLDLAALGLGATKRTIRPTLIRDCVTQGLGVPRVIGWETRRILETTDTVVVLGADETAVQASRLVMDGTRLIIRFGDTDDCCLWQLLIDWSRVTDVVYPAEHVRRAVENVLGDRIGHVSAHVLSGGLAFDGLDLPSTATAPRTLGIVNWAEPDKDPLWALEVLAILRAHDPLWRLKLIGADFPVKPDRPTDAQYAATFRARSLELADGIDYVGQTDHLPKHLADVGFAVNSSLRESFPADTLRIVAAHAVPVIRNWPVYRAVDGTADLFPPDWVVDSPEEAAERILAHGERQAWEASADAARLATRERFPLGDIIPEMTRPSEESMWPVR
jgi:glycosyltransferase involved in cell wall biosynthesis